MKAIRLRVGVAVIVIAFSFLIVSPAACEEKSIMLPGGTELLLVKIPAGTFQMGASSGERGAVADEYPQHKVTITRDYLIGKYEVTQAQWQAIMGSNPASGYGVGPSYPVYNVSWDDIAGTNGFITKLNEYLAQNGSPYAWMLRLPSEAEWEYAARGGTATRFSFGDNLSCDDGCGTCALADSYMWWCANWDGNNHPVGQKEPNPYGLHDMHGNLREYCQDWYGQYAGGDQVDPAGPSSGAFRVMRGGYGYHSVFCRSASRDDGNAPSSKDYASGFRLVLYDVFNCTSSTPMIGKAGSQLCFSAQSTDPNATYMWSYGDGCTSDQQNASHAFGAEGSFAWLLNVTNAVTGEVCSKSGIVEILSNESDIVYLNDNYNQIWRISMDGCARTLVVDKPVSGQQIAHIGVDEDNRLLAYGLKVNDSDYQVMIHDLEHSTDALNRITEWYYMPYWIPGSREVSYIGHSDSISIYKTTVPGGEESKWVAVENFSGYGLDAFRDFDWSVDGMKAVANVGCMGWGCNVGFTADFDFSTGNLANIQKVTPDAYSWDQVCTSIQISPDGNHIFYGWRDMYAGYCQIIRKKFDGSGEEVIWTMPAQEAFYWLRLDPAGKRLYFVGPSQEAPGLYALCSVKIDGSGYIEAYKTLSPIASFCVYGEPYKNPCSLSGSVSVPSTAQCGVQTNFQSVVNASSCDGATMYEWVFGDGKSSNLPNAEHAYAYPGSYSWNFTATNGVAKLEKSGTISVVGDCLLPDPQELINTSTFAAKLTFPSSTSWDINAIKSNSSFSDGVISSGYLIIMDRELSDFTPPPHGYNYLPIPAGIGLTYMIGSDNTIWVLSASSLPEAYRTLLGCSTSIDHAGNNSFYELLTLNDSDKLSLWNSGIKVHVSLHEKFLTLSKIAMWLYKQLVAQQLVSSPLSDRDLAVSTTVHIINNTGKRVAISYSACMTDCLNTWTFKRNDILNKWWPKGYSNACGAADWGYDLEISGQGVGWYTASHAYTDNGANAIIKWDGAPHCQALQYSSASHIMTDTSTPLPVTLDFMQESVWSANRSECILIAQADAISYKNVHGTRPGGPMMLPLTIYLEPSCPISCAATVPDSVNAGTSAVFKAQADLGNCTGQVTYLWNFGDDSASTQQNQPHIYTEPGTYHWTLKVRASESECIKSGTINVLSPCNITCSALANHLSGTAPMTVRFTSEATPEGCSGGNMTYMWEFGDGDTSAQQNPYHIYSDPGTYSWTYTASIGGQNCIKTGAVVVAGSGSIPGDCDGDGTVSIGEVQKAINMFLGGMAPDCGVDCNGDGQISIGEAQKAINAFLGMPTVC